MTRSISERGAKTWRLMVYCICLFWRGGGYFSRLTTAYISRLLDEIPLEEIRAWLCAMLSKPLPFFRRKPLLTL